MKYKLPRHDLVLASLSETRRNMLTSADLEYTAVASPVDEDALRMAGQAEGVTTPDMATALAEAKAARASLQYPDAFVIGADQLLDCDGEWFGKPETMGEAKDTLSKLQGKTHYLVTAAVIMHGGQRIWHQCSHPSVSIRSLDEKEIDTYLKTCGEAIFTTPGCYQIEKTGSQIISRIDGCPYSILGLPLLEMLSFLREHGLTAVELHESQIQ